MSQSLNSYYPVIIEVGSGYIRAGFAGESVPSVFYRLAPVETIDQANDKLPPCYELNESSIEKEHYDEIFFKWIQKDEKIKKIAQAYQADKKNWATIKSRSSRLLLSVFQELFGAHLLISPSKVKVIFVDDNYSLLTKITLCELLIERIGLRSLLWVPKACLSVAGAHECDGLVVDILWGSLAITPIIDFRTLDTFVDLKHLSGKLLYYKLLERLIEIDDPDVNSLLSRSTSHSLLVNFILNAMYVKSEYNENDWNDMFELSEGTVIPNSVRFEIIESCYLQESDLCKTITNVIGKSDLDVRSSLLQNIVITGDLSSIPGFKLKLLLAISRESNRDCQLRNTLGAWSSCSLYCSTTLANINNNLWKGQEITKQNLKNCLSENGFNLSLFPDSYNELYRMRNVSQ